MLTGAASLSFFLTAALHGSGYASVAAAAESVPGTIGQLIPALWLVFSSDLAVIGLIIAVLAFRPTPAARPILAIAALCPLAAASLQLVTIGFVPPTALLIAVGLLTLLSAVAAKPKAPQDRGAGSA